MNELTGEDFREMHRRSSESRIDWDDLDNYMYRLGFRAGVRIAQADAESASQRDELIADAAKLITDAAKPIADAAKPIDFDAIRDGDIIRRTVTHPDGTVTVTTGVVDRRDPFATGYVFTAGGAVLANRNPPAGTQTLEFLGRNNPEAGQYIWITEFKGEKLSEPILGRVSGTGFHDGVDALESLPDTSTWASANEVTAWKLAKVGGLDD